MATSSIFTTVRISDPKRAEAFINALDAAANSPKKNIQESNCSIVTDHKLISNFQ